jgi:cell wall-associated NlpC family hydrolase
MLEGAEGRDVKMLQEQLVELGYLSSGDVDRIYGEKTIEAVKAFQKRNGLTQDGKAGEKTLEKLFSDDAKMSKAMEEKVKAEEKAAKTTPKATQKSGSKTQKPGSKTTPKPTKKPTPTPKKDTKIDKFIKAANSKIGCEYVLGDSGPKTFDCSGFVTWCLRQAGVSTKRLNAEGFSKVSRWKNITKLSDLKRGDILFFKSDSSSRVSHTGIYIGSNTMIDASSSHGKVVKRALSAYFKRNFVNARRPWE